MSDNTRTKNRIFTIISILVLTLSAVLTLFVYWTPFVRLVESLCDLVKSFLYLFAYLFGKIFKKQAAVAPDIEVTAAHMPSFGLYKDYIGIDFQAIFESLAGYFSKVFNLLNFVQFNVRFLTWTSMILLWIIPVFLFGFMILSLMKDNFYEERPGSLGKRSRGYGAFVRLVLKLRAWLRVAMEYIKHFISKKYYVIPFVLIWIVNFGLCCFISDFFAFYMYFIVSYDLMSLLFFLLRLLLDILIIAKSVPLWLFIAVFCVAYHVYHKNAALDLLRHNEAKNCGLLKELELVILIVGESGKGKTTLMTDIVLSLVNIFKTDSLKILYKLELYFPAFDFASYRAYLVEKITSREVFCIPQINDIADRLYDEYERGEGSRLFAYDAELFGESIDLGSRILTLRDALVIYGKAFFVYQNNNPTVANYSIRFDGAFDDSPFLKLWDGDFFESDGESYYSHVLDSDIERFGKRVDPVGKFNGSFGWGIWVRTEAAKSYGNQISNGEYRRDEEDANPLNDLVEYSAKVGRHTNVMIDNKPFFRKLMDEQRAPDLAAKIRELCSIVSIKDQSELKLAITGYGWLFRLREKLGRFESFYLKYSNARADLTLCLLLPKLFVSFINLCCERLENVYGYREKTLIVEGGMAYSGHDGAPAGFREVTWYQANMKVYAERFASDCYSSFFTDMQKKCGYGIMDYPEYQSLNPTMDEYKAQKDYFLMKMMNIAYGIPTDEKTQTKKQKSADDIFAGLVFEE